MLLLISNIQRFRDGRQISEAGMPVHLPGAGPHCPLHFLKSLGCTISNISSTERQKSCTIYDVQGAIQSHKLHFLTPFYYIYMDIIYFTTFLSLSGGYIWYGAAEWFQELLHSASLTRRVTELGSKFQRICQNCVQTRSPSTFLIAHWSISTQLPLKHK